MRTDLIRVTEFGANVERPWEQANIKSEMSTVSVIRSCSCPCGECNKITYDTQVAFPEP